MNKPRIESFVCTDEYHRFVEFCDACKKYRYIGLCYGRPGVGKTLSARRYTAWDQFDAFMSDPDESTASLFSVPPALEEASRNGAVFFTPPIGNTPKQIEVGVRGARNHLYKIMEARLQRRADAEMREQNQAIFQYERDAPYDRMGLEQRRQKLYGLMEEHRYARDALRRRCHESPVSLLIIDETDRLKMASLEQVRDEFDRSGVGLVLIGMPGIEKRLARYPQLYSRVGFVHEFRPLNKAQVLSVLRASWRPEGVYLPMETFDNESLAAIVRITGGNFRLLHRLLSQIGRILEINALNNVTAPVVDAARESLVIGAA
jgi:DNA transposition AAA+ family ATPase